MSYRYKLLILFKSGNLWEVGVPTKVLGRTFARELVRKANDVDLVTLVTEKTGYVEVIDHRKFFN